MSFIDNIFAKKKTGHILDVTGCGFKIYIQSLYTFPLGFEIDEFADDRDPFDLPDIQIGSYQSDLNGNLVFWNRPVPFIVDLHLLEGTKGEANCRTLFNSNYQSGTKGAADDLITMVVTYSDGTKKIAVNGHINISSPLQSISANGRYKSQHYQFIFARPLN